MSLRGHWKATLTSHPRVRDATLKGLRTLGHQHWLPFGVRDRIIRRVVAPGSKDQAPFSVDFFGHRYDGTFASYIDWSVYFYGAYERRELLCLGDLCRALGPDITVLDIGANVGHHTLFFSGFARAVHAFEPWSGVGDILWRRVEANGLKNVTLHRVGLGREDARLPFYAPASENLGTGSFKEGNSPDNVPAGELVVRAGDAYLSEAQIDRVDLIKMDVEGFEENVLSGIRQHLLRDRPIVMMEYLWFGAKDPAAALARSFPDQYDFFFLHEAQDGYRLEPATPSVRERMLVAVPHEKAHAVLRARVEAAGATPRSRFARSLGRVPGLKRFA